MHFILQLKTIPLFIRYFFNVVDQHSLQSPYVFEFYTKLILAIKQNNGLEEVESLRHDFFRDNSHVYGQDLGAGSRVFNKTKEKTISKIARKGISSKKDCIFLYELVQLVQPKLCIELGTSLGIATSYLSKSTGQGLVYSFEGNKGLVTLARMVMDKLKCENTQIIHGDIDVELPEFLKKISEVDFALIDANHTENALLKYFNMMKSKFIKGGIMVIDDIRWSTGMYKAWEKVHSDERISISIEFLNKGLLIFDLGISKQHYMLSY